MYKPHAVLAFTDTQFWAPKQWFYFLQLRWPKFVIPFRTRICCFGFGGSFQILAAEFGKISQVYKFHMYSLKELWNWVCKLCLTGWLTEFSPRCVWKVLFEDNWNKKWRRLGESLCFYVFFSSVFYVFLIKLFDIVNVFQQKGACYSHI